MSESALASPNPLPDRDRVFLDWFASTYESPVYISLIKFGEIFYYRASVAERSGKVPFVATGRGQTELEAVKKATSEFIERKMFLDLNDEVLPSARGSCHFDLKGDIKLKSTFTRVAEMPHCMRTTNGWAVHPSPEAAIENAASEIIQRHCTTHSFLRRGWQGFTVVDEMVIEEIKFLSCIADVQVGGRGAGIVIGIVPGTGGAAFGSMADQASQLQTSARWQHAFYECYDAIDSFSHRSVRPENGIEALSQEYLSARIFDESQLSKTIAPYVERFPTIYFELFDLKEIIGSPTPLFAARATSPDLIPLFFPQLLDREGRDWIGAQLVRHRDFIIPERMPVL